MPMLAKSPRGGRQQPVQLNDRFSGLLIEIWQLQFSAVLRELVSERNSAMQRHARFGIVEPVACRLSATRFPDLPVG
jgi:hypothetical protein